MTSSPGPRPFYAFGPYRLDRETRLLTRDGSLVPLTPKVVDVLLLLVENRDRLVEKQELMRAVWPDSFVEESNLTQSISVLRKTLGSDAGGQPYIETIPKRGYRFVTPVAEAPAQGLAKRRTRSALALLALGVVLAGTTAYLLKSRGPSIPDIHSVVVLPLRNLSGDPEQEYFADGITAALIGKLAKLGQLRVISYTSAMHYKGTTERLPEVARELKVDAVVEGSVTRSGDRVRISVQLIYAATDGQLWADTYEREMRDVLTLQSEVATAIAHQVRIRITPAEEGRLASARAVNPRAYEAYLKGLYHFEKWSRESRLAIEYFQLAIEADPRYAPAYAGLAESYIWLLSSGYLAPKEAIAAARAAASRALEIDDTLSEAHTALALVLFWYDWDWSGAEKEFKRALDLKPHHTSTSRWYGHYLMAIGRTEESLAMTRRGLDLDPLSPLMNLELGWGYLDARQYDRAIEQLRKTLSLDPNYITAHGLLWSAYVLKGMHNEAVAELRKTMTLAGEEPEDVAAVGDAYAREGIHGVWRWRLKRAVRMGAAPYDVAVMQAALGEKEQALGWLEKALREHDASLRFLKVNAWFDPLRSDARFAALLKRIGLPE
jgi:TolB-like protein/DNA-binding winged helix-turn-helix (wHTH) protein